jgi:UDP-N-acetylmuramoylalanine--D-glutamate ligase
MKKEDLISKNISVVGLGKTGIAVVRYLNTIGAKHVFVSEMDTKTEYASELAGSGIEYELGMHSERIIKNTDLIIKSPGVPLHVPILKQAVKDKIKIWSEIELASQLVRPQRLIAITGTNGKTTTTTLIGELMKNAGYKTVVCGNIGDPLINHVQTIDNQATVVAELSSYQLETIEFFRPDISCILNITPDHLEHHETMDNYIMSKSHIFKNQDEHGYCIYDYDDELTLKLVKQKMVLGAKCRFVPFSTTKKIDNGLYFDKGNFVVDMSYFPKTVFDIKLKIPGVHNIENSLVSIASAVISGVKRETITDTLAGFTGVEHRLEFVRRLNGVDYVNDSKSTNVDSTSVALKSFTNPLILIMGGRDKGSPYTPLKSLIKQKVRFLLLIGESTDKIYNDLAGTTELIRCVTMEAALNKSVELSKPGDTVLFSPGCSSFDQFVNYEQRGKTFKTLVGKI